MAKGKRRNGTNRNQGSMAASEPSSLTTGNPGYPNTPEKEDFDISLVRMLVAENIEKSLKEIQEKMDQKLEALTRQIQKSLKETQENMLVFCPSSTPQLPGISQVCPPHMPGPL